MKVKCPNCGYELDEFTIALAGRCDEEEIKKVIEEVLLKRILLIGEHQTYTGTPAELMTELAHALRDYFMGEIK